MIIEQPACDWCTVTTFVHTEATRLFNACAANGKGHKKPLTIMGYEGSQWEGAFWGQGRQRDRVHYMARASGETAHYWLKDISDTCPGRATRVDLQITIPMPANYSAHRLDNDLRTLANWEGKGRARAINTIFGHPIGMDTVYIGSWKSDTFTRVYVKESNGKRYLRLEIVFKGDHADPIYTRCCVGGQDAINSIMATECKNMPDVPDLLPFKEILAAYECGRLIRGHREHDENGTIRWLRNQVSPTVFRMLNDHDYGDITGRLVQEWMDMARSLDRVDETLTKH